MIGEVVYVDTRPLGAKMSPRICRTLFTVLLQRYFRQHPEYKWDKDRTKTKVFIQAAEAIGARESNIIPSILVDSGGFSLADAGVGNSTLKMMQMPTLYQYQDFKQCGVRTSITLSCLADTAIDAEQLAWDLSTFLIAIKTTILEVTGAQYLALPQVSKAAKTLRNDWANCFEAQIMLSLELAVQVSVTPIDKGELLREINLVLDSDIDDDGSSAITDPKDPNKDGDGGGPDFNWDREPPTSDRYKRWSLGIFLKFRITKDGVTGEQLDRIPAEG